MGICTGLVELWITIQITSYFYILRMANIRRRLTQALDATLIGHAGTEEKPVSGSARREERRELPTICEVTDSRN